MKSVSNFLSCDWGTTSFRLRLVDARTLKILAEQKSKEGSASTYENWRETEKPDEERFAFYLSVIRKHLQVLEKESDISLAGLPLIISGMASSTIGMLELPYKELPFFIDGSDLKSQTFEATPDFQHQILLISGVKSERDVMRGEETQLVGCMMQKSPEDQLFIHPGTHSKHVLIKDGQALAFKTYMTGELFSLLSIESILAASVKHGKDIKLSDHLKSFEKGVKEGIGGNLLHQLFMVRTNDLFEQLNLQQNSYYLSGLLIGTELKDFPEHFNGKLILAGESILVAHYSEALRVLGIHNRISGFEVRNADEVTMKGQFQVFAQLKR